MKKVAVIICAAGASARFGGNKKKPFVEVGGRAAFLRSIEFFADRDDVKQILLTISPDDDELVKLLSAIGTYIVTDIRNKKERIQLIREKAEFAEVNGLKVLFFMEDVPDPKLSTCCGPAVLASFR